MPLTKVNAQLLEGAITADSSDNVGIGTASPTNKLFVYDASKTSTTQFANVIASFRANGTNADACIQLSDNVSNSIQIGLIGGTSGGLGFSSNGAETVRIAADGTLTMRIAAGMGYGTGSGGAVTQATNKSTGVTLNKPAGQITMNNAALNAGTSVSFLFSNSLLTTTDLLVVNSNTSSNYRVEVANVAAGAANIRVTNVSGGSLSDPLVIGFAVIKGATS